MRSNTGNNIVVGLVFVALAAILSPAVSGQVKGGRSLEGAWDMSITFRNCVTGEAIRERAGLISFMFGGVLQEFGTGQMVPRDRTDAHGNWSHVSGAQYYAVSKAFRFNADGSLAGTAKLYRSIDVAVDGRSFSASVTSEIFDTGGNLIANGCATETGTRIE